MCKPVQVTHTTGSQVVKGVPSFHPTEAVLLSYASAVVETSACERKVKLDDLVIACVKGHGHVGVREFYQCPSGDVLFL